MKLDNKYAYYFPEYSSYFGRALLLLKSMYGMTNYGKLFADDLTDQWIEAGLIQYQLQRSIYYKYVPDGKNWLCYIMLMTLSIGIHIKLL